jgi:hypothetical protein
MATADKQPAISKFPSTPLHLKAEGLKAAKPEEVQGNALIDTGIAALQRTENIIEETAETLKGLNKDESRNFVNKQVAAYEYGDRMYNKITNNSKAEGQLRDEVRKINKDIENSLTDEAARHPFAQEARSIFRDMDEAKRVRYLENAITNQDFEYAEFILGAPTHLTGLKPKDRERLTEHYKKTRFKDRIAYRDYVKKLADSVGNLSNHYMKYVKTLENEDVIRALKTRKDVDQKLEL